MPTPRPSLCSGPNARQTTPTPPRPAPRSRQHKRSLYEPDFCHRETLSPVAAAPLRHLVPPCRVPDELGWPKGTRLLRFHNDPFQATLRIPLSPETWTALAVELPHPATVLSALDPWLNAAILAEAYQSPLDLATARTAAARDLKRRRLQAASEEAALRRHLEPAVQHVTAPKQTQCLHSVLQHYSYPDTKLAGELRAGFPLVGWLDPSGIWPTDLQPPALTVAGLEAVADDISRHTARAVARAPVGPIRDAMWAATLAERDQGWLTIHPNPPPLPGRVVSVRFGVEQKNKIRPIDNFKGSKINAACGTQEKVQIDGIDQIVQAALTLLSHGLPTAAGDRLQGRTWDLKSAYTNSWPSARTRST